MWEDVKTYSFIQNAGSGTRIYATENCATASGAFIVYSDSRKVLTGKLTNFEIDAGTSGTEIGLVAENGSLFFGFSGTTLSQLGVLVAASGTKLQRYYPAAFAQDSTGATTSGTHIVPVYLDGRVLYLAGSGLGAAGTHIGKFMLTWI